MHTKMHFPLSPVLKSSSATTYRDTSTTYFLYKGTALKNTASHFTTFLPFSASKFLQKQIYSFSKMNLKDVHIKKIKPTKSSKV